MKLSILDLEEDKVDSLNFQELVEYADSYRKVSQKVRDDKKSVLEKIVERLKEMSYDDLDDDDIGSFLYRRKSLPEGLGKDPKILKKIKVRAKKLHAEETSRGKRPSLDGCISDADMKKEVADWSFSDCVYYCRDMTQKPKVTEEDPFGKKRFKFVMKKYQVNKAALMEDFEEIGDVRLGEEGAYRDFCNEAIKLLSKAGAYGPDGKDETKKYVSLEDVEAMLKDVQEGLTENVEEYTLQSVSGFQGKKVPDYTKIAPGCIGGKMLRKKIKIINAFITALGKKLKKAELEKKLKKAELGRKLQESIEKRKLKEDEKREREKEEEEIRRKVKENKEKEKEKKKAIEANDENDEDDENKSIDEIKESVEQILSGDGSNIDQLMALIDKMSKETYASIKDDMDDDIDSYFDEYESFLSGMLQDTTLENLTEEILKPSPYKEKHTAKFYKQKRRALASAIKEKVSSIQIEEYNDSSEKILDSFQYCCSKILSSAADALAGGLVKSLTGKADTLAGSICKALLNDESLSVLDKSGIGLLTWEKLLNRLQKSTLSGFNKASGKYHKTILSQIIKGLPESKDAYIHYLSNAKFPKLFSEVKESKQWKEFIQDIESMSLRDCLSLEREEQLLTKEQKEALENRINILLNSFDKVEKINIQKADTATRCLYLQSKEILENEKFKSVIEQIEADFDEKCQGDCSIYNFNEYMEILASLSDPKTDPAKKLRKTVYSKINAFLEIYNSDKNLLNQWGGRGDLKGHIKVLEQIVKQYSKYKGYVKLLVERTEFAIAFLSYWLPPTDPDAKKFKSYYRLSYEEIYSSLQAQGGWDMLLTDYGEYLKVENDKQLEIAVNLLSQGYDIKRFLAAGGEGAYFLCSPIGGGEDIAVKGFFSGGSSSVFAEKAAQMELQELAEDNPNVRKYLALSKDNDGSFETELAMGDMSKTAEIGSYSHADQVTFPSGKTGYKCQVNLGENGLADRYLAEDGTTRVDADGQSLPTETVKEMDDNEGPLKIQQSPNGVVAQIQRKRNETLDGVLATAYQTMQAISILQKDGFVHGDIKPQNIIQIKNSNFGSEKKEAQEAEKLFFEGQENVYKVTDLSMCTIKSAIAGAGVFTPGFRPENDPPLDSLSSEEKEDLVKKRDVYALGKTLLDFAFHEGSLYASAQKLMDMIAVSPKIINKVYEEIKEKCYTGVANGEQFIKFLTLLCKMTLASYKNRPSIDEALKDVIAIQKMK